MREINLPIRHGKKIHRGCDSYFGMLSKLASLFLAMILQRDN
jgi:hypothetical protein